MSVTHTHENEGQYTAHPSDVPDQAEASALDRRIEQMLEAEMAKGLIASFTEDFKSLMQRLETGIRAEHAAMDKLRQRLRAS